MALVEEDEAGAVIQGPPLLRKKRTLLKLPSGAKKVNLSAATNFSVGGLRWLLWTHIHHAGARFNDA